jgi:archaemetzincin
MKLLLLLTVALATFFSCGKSRPILSLNSGKQNQIISIQPLGEFDDQLIDSVANELSHFFNKKVVILKPIEIPKTFFLPILSQYSGDSIIQYLSHLQNDSIIEIVGLTHSPIFTIKTVENGAYYNEKIFGIGYQPGNSCVVSDFKFGVTNDPNLIHRLKTVIIHEIGHNIGLPHCKDEKCVMSENNGSLPMLDKSGSEYCDKCKRMLKQ